MFMKFVKTTISKVQICLDEHEEGVNNPITFRTPFISLYHESFLR